MRQPDGMDCDGEDGRFEQLLTEEVQLLQQLSNKDTPVGVTVSLEQLLQPDSSTIALSTDPMAYLTYITCQPPSEATLSMDGQALAAVYKRDVPALGMQLHQLAIATLRERPGLIKQMADIWTTYVLLPSAVEGQTTGNTRCSCCRFLLLDVLSCQHTCLARGVDAWHGHWLLPA